MDFVVKQHLPKEKSTRDMFLLSRQQAISGGCTWSHFSVCHVFTASYIQAGSEQLKSFPLKFKQCFFFLVCGKNYCKCCPFLNFDVMVCLVRFTSKCGQSHLVHRQGRKRRRQKCAQKCMFVVLVGSSPTTQNTPLSGEIAHHMHPSPINGFNANLGFINLFKEALTRRSKQQPPPQHLSHSRPMQRDRHPTEMAQMSPVA